MNTADRDIDRLGELVKSRFDKARAAKQPHHSTMLDCMRLMNGESLTTAADNAPDIVMNVSAPVVKNVTALILDVFSGSAIANPYTINATPVVDLPDDVEAEMLSRIQVDLEQMVLMAGGDTSVVREQIEATRTALVVEENRKAVAAADRLTTIIADRLHDANWTDEFASFITHFCIYPAAIMKAPAMRESLTPRWNGHSIDTVPDVIRGVECISPLDFYPAPFAADIQSADYVIERRRLTRNELRALRDAAGYDADAINDVFELFPDGAPLSYSTDESDPTSDTIGDSADRDVYDALGYYGRIRNDVLAEYGIDFADDELTAASEAEVWVVGTRVIKCLLSVHPVGQRPFYKASFERVPGAFWGVSPAMMLMDTQKVCTASVRALVRNLQYSSGPIGEVTAGRVKDGADPALVIPNTIRLVTDNNGYADNGPAYRFHTVPSLSNELSALFEKFVSYGYELLGIPRMAFGGTADLGSVGRTSGGMSIIMNQATKSIKRALRVLETELVEPVVQDFVDYEIRTSDDPTIRGDVKVYARGVSGLLEKESKTADLEWALQSLTGLAGVIDPTTQQSIIPPQAFQRLMYQIFKNKGIPTSGIFPDFDRDDALSEVLQGADTIAPDAAPGAQPVMPDAGMPQLDGRSADAAAAIQASNGVV